LHLLAMKSPVEMEKRVGGFSWWDVGRFFSGLIPVAGSFLSEGLTALETGTNYDVGRAAAHAGTSLASSLVPGGSLIEQGLKAAGTSLIDGAVDKAIGDRQGGKTEEKPKKKTRPVKRKIRETSKKRGLSAKQASKIFKKAKAD